MPWIMCKRIHFARKTSHRTILVYNLLGGGGGMWLKRRQIRHRIQILNLVTLIIGSGISVAYHKYTVT